MLVCSVSQLQRRAAIAADLAEAAAALDAPGTGNVVFATLVDDPASVGDQVDAFLGQIMREAANAAATVNAGLAYAAGIGEVAGAGSIVDAGFLRSATVVEAATAADAPSIASAAFAATVAEPAAASSLESATITSTGDPNFASVKLLMGFNGTNGASSGPGFTDESGAAHGVASQGGAPIISTAQSVFGGSSMKFSGFERVYFPDHADWNLSNVPFTIEFRLQHNNAGVAYVVGQWDASPNQGWILYVNAGVLTFNVSTTGANNNVQVTGSTLSANTWYAVALDFDGTKYRMYVNGTMVGSSTTLRTIFDSPLNLAFGSSSAGGSYLIGYIDEFRLTKGVARYASDTGYAVATAAFPRS